METPRVGTNSGYHEHSLILQPRSAHTYTLTRWETKPVEGIRTRMIDRIATSLTGPVAMGDQIRRTKAAEARTTITAAAVVAIPGALTTGIVGIERR